MAISSVLFNIVRKYSIVEYLKKMGHEPVREMSDGKLFYWCPIPGHVEVNAPSFVVYTNGEFENFYCFGCGAKYHILDLISLIENKSKKEVFEKLSEGLNFDILDDINFQIEQLNQLCKEPYDMQKLADYMLEISEICRIYLESTSFDPVEVNIIDKFYEELDKVILSYNFDNVQKIAEWLPEYILARKQKFSEDNEECHT